MRIHISTAWIIKSSSQKYLFLIVYVFIVRDLVGRRFGKYKNLVLTENKTMFILCNNDGN